MRKQPLEPTISRKQSLATRARFAVVAVCMLLAGLPLLAVAATPLGMWATVDLDDSQGLSGIEFTIDGVTIRPLAGACAIGEDRQPDATIHLDVKARVRGRMLEVSVTSKDPRARGIDPGRAEGLADWVRLHLSRQAAPYGQTWWPSTLYSAKGDFWFTAHWMLEESNATSWEAVDQAPQGKGPVPVTHRLVYEPDTAGKYLPLHEVLQIRVSRRLWSVVPVLTQNSSEYREELARSVFVDFWGGAAASELSHFLGIMGEIGRDRLRYLTILQNWEVGGWDALLPDSVWMPDYPPNPSVGTIEELRALCELGKSIGRFGFRTNYRQLRENAPGFTRGIAHFAVNSDGSSRGYLRPADWPAVAGRQEAEIRDLFAPNTSFTDELLAGASPSAWHDFAAENGNRSMRESLARQRGLARLIRTTHKGPLGSESLMDQAMLGEYVETGDYTFMNGHNRLYSPEFKLRRLHGLSTFHGMGLMYRFFEFPPFKQFHSGKKPYKTDQSLLNDYRCCEVLFGNGAYVCYPFANWRYYLTECLLVGHLQRYYALRPVRRVLYWHEGEWVSLEDLVRGGTVPNIVPWLPPTQEFGRIRVEYAGGLNVVVNRLDEPFPVRGPCHGPLLLPKYGWAVWTDDCSVVAFSAPWPDTQHRVDYLRDDKQRIEYIDPRGEFVRGVSDITFWEAGRVVIEADLEGGTIRIGDRTVPLTLPAPPPVESLDFGFDTSPEGWGIGAGILTATVTGGQLVVHTISPDPQLYSPALRVPGDSVKAIEVRMRASAGKMGQLYFTTDGDPSIAEDKVVRFEVIPDGKLHTIVIKVGDHPKWRNKVVTGLRLDPVHGPAEADIAIDSLRVVPAER